MILMAILQNLNWDNLCYSYSFHVFTSELHLLGILYFNTFLFSCAQSAISPCNIWQLKIELSLSTRFTGYSLFFSGNCTNLKQKVLRCLFSSTLQKHFTSGKNMNKIDFILMITNKICQRFRPHGEPGFSLISFWPHASTYCLLQVQK